MCSGRHKFELDCVFVPSSRTELGMFGFMNSIFLHLGERDDSVVLYTRTRCNKILNELLPRTQS